MEFKQDWIDSYAVLEKAVAKHGVSPEQLTKELWPDNRFQPEIDWQDKLRGRRAADGNSIREDPEVDNAFLRFLALASELQELNRWIAARMNSARE